MINIANCWTEISRLVSIGEIGKAIAICEAGPCSGLLECQRYLGWHYYKKGDMEKALIWFAQAADQKDGEGLFGMGSVHVAQKEFQKALQYFECAAGHGYIRAYQWIAGIYQHGCGVPPDIDKATNYYQQGAVHGFIMAERSLINLTSKNGNVLVQILSLLKLVSLQIRTAKIAYQNMNDPRLADVQRRVRLKG